MFPASVHIHFTRLSKAQREASELTVLHKFEEIVGKRKMMLTLRGARTHTRRNARSDPCALCLNMAHLLDLRLRRLLPSQRYNHSGAGTAQHASCSTIEHVQLIEVYAY